MKLTPARGPTGASAASSSATISSAASRPSPDQQLVLLTATPHSGKPEEFQSLLGLLKPEFESARPAHAPRRAQRRELARHFVQRKRADVEKWMGEDTPFPQREAFEWPTTVARVRSVLRRDARLRPKAGCAR